MIWMRKSKRPWSKRNVKFLRDLVTSLSCLYQQSLNLTFVCPFAHTNRHDFPGLVDELVPGVACRIDDVFVTVEDAVRQVGLPMAMGYGGPAPFAFARPSPQPRHLHRRAGLVDEDQPFRSEPCLAFEPEPAPREHVRAPLLRCMAGLFLCVSPRLAKKCQTVDGHTRTPCDAASFSPISASVIALVCATRARIKASCASSFEPGGWPWRSGSIEPVSRQRRRQWIAVAGATRKRAAAPRADRPQ